MTAETTVNTFAIRPATPHDVAHIMSMIRELAVFEKLEDMVVATDALLHEGLFGAHPSCEAIIGEADGEVVSYALFFHNFSTFLTKKGLYLEDLYVRQSHRGKGYGNRMLKHLARIAVERECGRFEWSVLDWNMPAINFYKSMGAEILPDWRICRVTGEPLAALAQG
jgi:GNAT superfamily N-acetyltransferase